MSVSPNWVPPPEPKLPFGKLALIGASALIGLILFIFAISAGCQAFNRYQNRANANNNVRVSAIQIRNQAQRVKITKQKAQIRYQSAVGVRHAQDEIAKTLTPLYVQFEMIDALKAIAASGRNNSLVYIPTGAAGVPLVSLTGQPQVFQGATKGSK